jgi:2-oxoglutarate ferredoxin oxidoreductase subunit beta
MRRNVDIKILLFDNRIYGLTKGQYSPTSEVGKKTVSTPWGSVDHPINPVSLALGAEASFVARTMDRDTKHMREILRRAGEHRGCAFIHILQNCPVFNDGAFEHLTDKEVRDENVMYLEHGKPMLFGKGRTRGLRLKGTVPEVVELGDGISEEDLLIHDEKRDDPAVAFMLSRLEEPAYPVPLGVLRAVDIPAYDELIHNQLARAKEKIGEGTLDSLLYTHDAWEVK